MNTTVSILKGPENPSLYTQAVTEFSKITHLLEEDNIRVQDNMHMGRDFMEAMILVVQKDFPVQANTFRMVYSGLSRQDRETFRLAHVQPFLLIPFCKRTQELLVRRG